MSWIAATAAPHRNPNAKTVRVRRLFLRRATALKNPNATPIIAMFPTSIGGAPWDASFEWKFVNYTPLLVGGVLILLWIYWHVSVKNWFTGPIKQVDITGEELEGVS